MQVLNMCGEEYYRVDKVYEFIALCNVRKNVSFVWNSLKFQVNKLSHLNIYKA